MVGLMMKSLLFSCLAAVLVGCQTTDSLTARTPVAPGSYQFPYEVDLHNPVFVITATNTFAFVGETDEPWANHGTVEVRDHGKTLLLHYEEVECCQYNGIEEETMVILESRPDALRVRYRDKEHLLKRIEP